MDEVTATNNSAVQAQQLGEDILKELEQAAASASVVAPAESTSIDESPELVEFRNEIDRIVEEYLAKRAALEEAARIESSTAAVSPSVEDQIRQIKAGIGINQ